jgi:hypothetical protein
MEVVRRSLELLCLSAAPSFPAALSTPTPFEYSPYKKGRGQRYFLIETGPILVEAGILMPLTTHEERRRSCSPF